MKQRIKLLCLLFCCLTASSAMSKALPIGAKEMRLDATSLSSGIYILSYSVDGQIIDSQKFNKK